MATRAEKRALLVKEFEEQQAKVKRLDLELLRLYPTADARKTTALKIECEAAHEELKKLDKRVNGGGIAKEPSKQLEWCR